MQFQNLTLRSLLQKIITAMTLVGIIAFSTVLLYSYGPSYIAVKNIYYFDISDIQPGNVKQFQLPRSNVPIVVVNPDQNILNDLNKLDAFVWHQTARTTSTNGVFIFIPLSTRHGCMLEHVPKQYFSHSIEVDWQGGFIDPCHDSAYDYAGRALKPGRFQLKGWPLLVDDLQQPSFTISSKKQLRIEDNGQLRDQYTYLPIKNYR